MTTAEIEALLAANGFVWIGRPNKRFYVKPFYGTDTALILWSYVNGPDHQRAALDATHLTTEYGFGRARWLNGEQTHIHPGKIDTLEYFLKVIAAGDLSPDYDCNAICATRKNLPRRIVQEPA